MSHIIGLIPFSEIVYKRDTMNLLRFSRFIMLVLRNNCYVTIESGSVITGIYNIVFVAYVVDPCTTLYLHIWGNLHF